MNTKIFKNNLKNSSKTIGFRIKKDKIGNSKYLPSFSKEWKNTVYSFDKNILSNIPTYTENIKNILKSYFNLFIKDYKGIGIYKFILLKRRRNFLRRIFISNPEIKHTNDKIIITLYALNREKNILKKKYDKMNYKINKKLLKQFFFLYITNLNKIHKFLMSLKKKYIFIPSVLNKKMYLKSKFEKLNKFQNIKHIYLKRI